MDGPETKKGILSLPPPSLSPMSNLFLYKRCTRSFLLTLTIQLTQTSAYLSLPPSLSLSLSLSLEHSYELSTQHSSFVLSIAHFLWLKSAFESLGIVCLQTHQLSVCL